MKQLLQYINKVVFWSSIYSFYTNEPSPCLLLGGDKVFALGLLSQKCLKQKHVKNVKSIKSDDLSYHRPLL